MTSANGVTGRRWQKAGNDRLYVSLDGSDLGWVDLVSGALHPGEQVPVQVLAAAAARAAVNLGIPLPAFTLRGVPWPDATPTVKAHDLAGRTPGKGVAAEARRERQGVTKAALDWMGPQGLSDAGVTRQDRSWAAGAKGERLVGRILNDYADTHAQDGWRVLHSVPLASGGDIDHVLVGPAGVLTVNTKYHQGRVLAVTESGLYLDGEPVDYAAKALGEAELAARLLSKKLGWTPPVSSMIVLAQGHLDIKSKRRGVVVLPATRLASWLDRTPVLLDPVAVSRLYGVARNRQTWMPSR